MEGPTRARPPRNVTIATTVLAERHRGDPAPSGGAEVEVGAAARDAHHREGDRRAGRDERREGERGRAGQDALAGQDVGAVGDRGGQAQRGRQRVQGAGARSREDEGRAGQRGGQRGEAAPRWPARGAARCAAAVTIAG